MLGKFQLLLHIGHSFHLKRLYFSFSLTSFALFIFTCFDLLWESVCNVYLCAGECSWTTASMWRPQDSLQEAVSPSTMWVLGIKLSLQARQPVPSPSGSPLFGNACCLFSIMWWTPVSNRCVTSLDTTKKPWTQGALPRADVNFLYSYTLSLKRYRHGSREAGSRCFQQTLWINIKTCFLFIFTTAIFSLTSES